MIKSKVPHPLLAMFLAFTAFGSGVAQSSSGIPEPDLILFGNLTSTNGADLALAGSVVWNISDGSSSASIAATMVNVNGQTFYVARIPFETRLAGGQSLTPSPNTLPLTQTATTFKRSAKAFGTNATILPPALETFSFAAADCGRIERVDLRVSGAVAVATNSIPRFLSALKPAVVAGHFEGIGFEWLSIPGQRYSVERSEDLGKGFTPLKIGISATDSKTTSFDASATGLGPYFYRIRVEP